MHVTPLNASLPLLCRHTYIMIHPPIDTADKTVKEIQSECFEVSVTCVPVTDCVLCFLSISYAAGDKCWPAGLSEIQPA